MIAKNRLFKLTCLLGSLMTFGQIGMAAASAAQEPFGMMDVTDVAKRVSEKSAFVFDANSDKVYAEGHVPSAQHVAFDTLTASQLPGDKASTLVFYCKNTKCMASHEAAKRASTMGYQHVYVMPQGIDGWKASGEPTVVGAQPGAFPKKAS